MKPSLTPSCAPAKPFLKWAGGKSQLLNELAARLPKSVLETMHVERYIEPFIGGGALFFHMQNNFHIEKSYIFDINRNLIIAYKVVKDSIEKLLQELDTLKQEYLSANDDNRKKYYYSIRDKYNSQMLNFDYSEFNPDWINRASYLLFLNKTCFNGLYRLNSSGAFNVPHGRYSNPSIVNPDNLRAASAALANTTIICGDFMSSGKYVNDSTFIYLDPPYRPLNQTSSFTSYSKHGFDEKDQIRLSQYYSKMDSKGAFLMLSNSDPKNEDDTDNFFDDLYSDYKIERVLANRMINCNSKGRGRISELIITNYSR